MELKQSHVYTLFYTKHLFFFLFLFQNLGGDTPIHCEQAVIGLKKSKQLIIEMRGGGRGRGSRGGDRLRGRGIERGGMGRFMERGGRGMRGRPALNPYNDMGGMQEEEYYEETFDRSQFMITSLEVALSCMEHLEEEAYWVEKGLQLEEELACGVVPLAGAFLQVEAGA